MEKNTKKQKREDVDLFAMLSMEIDRLKNELDQIDPHGAGSISDGLFRLLKMRAVDSLTDEAKYFILSGHDVDAIADLQSAIKVIAMQQ